MAVLQTTFDVKPTTFCHDATSNSIVPKGRVIGLDAWYNPIETPVN